MGFFDGVSDVDPAGGSNRLTAGQYTLKVISCKVNQGFTGNRFIAEFEVLESSGERAAEVGSTGSWTVEVGGQYAKISLAELSAFWLACQGEDPRATERRPRPEDLTAATGPQNALAGKILRTEAWDHRTKSGRDMVKHAWYPAEGAVPSAAAPPPPPAAAPPPAFPPPGWLPHPQAPGYFYKGQAVVSEADLRAGRLPDGA